MEIEEFRKQNKMPSVMKKKSSKEGGKFQKR
jgi:hypothetical protein